MLYIPSEQLPSFIGGIIGIFILWLILYGVTRISTATKVAIIKTANTRQMALFFLNLVIVAIGLSIAVDALVIAEGGGKMNPEELSQLFVSAQGLLHMVYILLGVSFGAIVLWIIHLIIISIRERISVREDNRETVITISANRLDAITKEVKEYKQAKNALDHFLNNLQE